MVAESYAQDFNRTSSKKKVAFLPVSVVHLQRPFMGATYVCLEPLMDGRYVKHSNNYGGVSTRDEVPQAFSHFTYEAMLPSTPVSPSSSSDGSRAAVEHQWLQ